MGSRRGPRIGSSSLRFRATLFLNNVRCCICCIDSKIVASGIVAENPKLLKQKERILPQTVVLMAV